VLDERLEGGGDAGARLRLPPLARRHLEQVVELAQVEHPRVEHAPAAGGAHGEELEQALGVARAQGVVELDVHPRGDPGGRLVEPERVDAQPLDRVVRRVAPPLGLDVVLEHPVLPLALAHRRGAVGDERVARPGAHEGRAVAVVDVEPRVEDQAAEAREGALDRLDLLAADGPVAAAGGAEDGAVAGSTK
jgi:hypothetical protein